MPLSGSHRRTSPPSWRLQRSGRGKADSVAKHSRNKWPRHVMIFHHLIDSQAWKSLGAIPRAVYLDIHKRYHGGNNGRIGYSIRCAVEELHIGNATVEAQLAEARGET